MNTELLTVKVIRKTMETEDIACFKLVHPDGDELPAFTAGSHIDVHIDDAHIRQYSLCNDPDERHHYLLGVLREPKSTGGSTAMYDTVQEGHFLQISAPRNSFHLNEDGAYSLLLAGGIGVTPILSMAQRLSKLGNHFDMHYCTRSRQRTAFYTFLKGSAFNERVHFHFDDGPKKQLLNIPALVAERPDDANLYVCGPSGFMDAVINNAEKGWPADSVHREYFSADPQAGRDHDDSFQVKIQSTGEIYNIPSDKTIVESLGEHGIEIPVSCEQGICGTCLTGVLEGIPEHRDLFLSDDAHAANDQMTTCCSRAKSKLLVLDL